LNYWVRQIHRWMSVAFTVAVIATFIALAQKPPVVWVSYVPLAFSSSRGRTCSCCPTPRSGAADGAPTDSSGSLCSYLAIPTGIRTGAASLSVFGTVRIESQPTIVRLALVLPCRHAWLSTGSMPVCSTS
jgi:hypothetical protein